MRIALGAASICLALAALVWLSRDLAPPSRLEFAAGGRGGGYWQIAERYRAILARDGIEVRLLETAGSVENARLIGAGQADAGLLQGGVAALPGTEALGAIFLEPLFLFTRRDGAIPRNPAEWSGLRIAAGGPGSGTRAAIEGFAEAIGLDPAANELVPLGGRAGADALLAGEVDIAAFVAPAAAPYLAPLFRAEEVALLPLEPIGVLTRLWPQSRLVTLPAGGVQLSPPVPQEEIQLLAMVARMAARADLHPSLVDRLVEAAREIHGGRDMLTDEGAFPTTEAAAMPVDVYAGDLIRSGPSPLQQYLPYWVVAQINRFAILLLPVIFLLIPLVRLVPGLYSWRMRARVYRFYARVRDIEVEAQTAGAEELPKLDRELAALDEEVAGLALPLPYRDYAYTARLHIDLVRQRISHRLARPTEAS
ncbi:MAG: TAXI family TRAP transporter solute-binding subunit [Pseudomonadota bacterium]